MEPTVQVAVIGILTTLITTAGVVIAAIVNNKRERTSSASGGVEAALRERITLKDEQLADLREDKIILQRRLDEALAVLDEKDMLVKHLRRELADVHAEIDRLNAEIARLRHNGPSAKEAQ